MATNNPTHAELWRMAVDEGRQTVADESEVDDGLGMVDDAGDSGPDHSRVYCRPCFCGGGQDCEARA